MNNYSQSQQGNVAKMSIVKSKDRMTMENFVKMTIFGPPGIGKTSLLKTLDCKTLCVDLEAGMLAVQDWDGDSLSIRSWEEARNLACLLGGPNPAARPGTSYSFSDYDKVCKTYGDPASLVSYQCIFIDSITVASRLCFQWCQSQPECLRNGKIDVRSAYGLLGREMLGWITQLQHIKNKDIVLVGILEQKLDEDNKPIWSMQCEGAKTAAELPGIVDEVICMVPHTQSKDGLKRIFVCDALNPYGYPAKDRSGALEIHEEAHLGKLLAKIKSKNRKPVEPESLDTIKLKINSIDSPGDLKECKKLIVNASSFFPGEEVEVLKSMYNDKFNSVTATAQ